MTPAHSRLLLFLTGYFGTSHYRSKRRLFLQIADRTYERGFVLITSFGVTPYVCKTEDFVERQDT